MSPPPAKTADFVGPDALEHELKELIVEALMLEDTQPQDIDRDAPLFGEPVAGKGLGLDSIDVLELAMALGRRYGVRTKADDERNREIFASVRNLAAFIAQERADAGGVP